MWHVLPFNFWQQKQAVFDKPVPIPVGIQAPASQSYIERIHRIHRKNLLCIRAAFIWQDKSYGQVARDDGWKCMLDHWQMLAFSNSVREHSWTATWVRAVAIFVTWHTKHTSDPSSSTPPLSGIHLPVRTSTSWNRFNDTWLATWLATTTPTVASLQCCATSSGQHWSSVVITAAWLW